jgi:hypothetical protein
MELRLVIALVPWMLLGTHLSSYNHSTAIGRPGECECLPTDIQAAHTCLGAHIPKAHRSIYGTARQLRVSDGVEQDLLDAGSVTAQLGRVSNSRTLRVPDPQRSISGASRNQLAGRVPCKCTDAVAEKLRQCLLRAGWYRKSSRMRPGSFRSGIIIALSLDAAEDEREVVFGEEFSARRGRHNL